MYWLLAVFVNINSPAKRCLCISAFLLLEACAAFSRAKEKNLYQIKPGETKAEVSEILGEPEKQFPSGIYEKWYYDIYSDDSGRSYPYTATFENGILTQWFFDTARHDPAANSKKTAGGGGRGGH